MWLLFLANSLFGATFLSLVLSYLVQVYSALRERNARALTIDLLSDGTGDAAVMLARLMPKGNSGNAVSELGNLVRSLAVTNEAHYFYPLLFRFRYRELRYSVSPPADLTPGLLRRSDRRSFCEWKGEAVSWHLVVGDAVLRDVAWSYPEPASAFAILCDHVAFYAGPLDRCTVDGEPVVPQPGGFYGGWITADLAGPFKGVPGSMGW